MENYRKIYEKELGIFWDSDSFNVHHINMDRRDNRIENLTLLPKKLHCKYHYYSKFVDMYETFFDEKQLDYCSYLNAEDKIEKQFKKFLEIKKEVTMLNYLKDVYVNTKRFNK